MSQRMKVAMIIQSYYPRVGGAERQLAQLAPLLRARGVDLHVLTRRYRGLSPYECVAGVPVHRLPVPGPKAAAALSFTLTALSLLKEIDPSVVHAHELLSPASTAVAAKRLFGKPVVAKVLRGGLLGDLAKLRRKPLGAYRIRTLREQVDAFIVISREIDAELADLQVAPGKRVFIPNGVDSEHFAPLPEADRQPARERLGFGQEPVALFAGRFAPEKRLDQLVDLWPQVRRAFPLARLVLLGEGEQQAELEQRHTPGVQILPPVDDVAPYYQAADLFILPSATEGLSNSLLEAMSTGLPVIATRVGGAPDLIEHGKSGWLAPPDQPQALQEAILTLFSSADTRQAMGARGREKVRQEYSLPAIADRLHTLYHTLADHQ